MAGGIEQPTCASTTLSRFAAECTVHDGVGGCTSRGSTSRGAAWPAGIERRRRRPHPPTASCPSPSIRGPKAVPAMFSEDCSPCICPRCFRLTRQSDARRLAPRGTLTRLSPRRALCHERAWLLKKSWQVYPKKAGTSEARTVPFMPCDKSGRFRGGGVRGCELGP